jgi:hypothetical protein
VLLKNGGTSPEPFQLVTAATVTCGAAKIEVPMLVLYGEWLKAVEFRSAPRRA